MPGTLESLCFPFEVTEYVRKAGASGVALLEQNCLDSVVLKVWEIASYFKSQKSTLNEKRNTCAKPGAGRVAVLEQKCLKSVVFNVGRLLRTLQAQKKTRRIGEHKHKAGESKVAIVAH